MCVYKHELMISLTGDHAMCLKEGRKAMWECLEGERKVTDILIIYISNINMKKTFWYDYSTCLLPGMTK